MDASKYQETIFDKPARRPGDQWAFTYYQPRTLPRTLDLTADTVLELSEADSALGHLQGLGRLIPQPDFLVGPFLTREALASSRIEGTNASLTEVLKAEEAVVEKSDDVAEVERYLAASRRGLLLIETLPLTQRVFKDIHAVLMAGVRGEDRQPGELRWSPVWIGSATATPETATFVPPLPEHLPDLLTDWERFVNEPSRLPPLVRCALAHYQFETIHPFLDGNGRIGRLMIILQLITQTRLSAPLLYLSGYLEVHRQEYYERLQAVRERGDVQGWIQFFCRAVRAQSEDAATRAGQIVDLRERYLAEVHNDRSTILGVIPLIFQNPFVTVRRVERALGVTPQGARNLLERAEKLGWVEYAGSSGRGGRHFFAATEVLRVIELPTAYSGAARP